MGIEQPGPGTLPELPKTRPEAQGELVQFEGAARERQESLMTRIFDIEERFDGALGRIAMYSKGNNNIPHINDELRDIREEMVLLMLSQANVSLDRWTSYVRNRLDGGRK